MYIVQELVKSLYDTFVEAGTAYFRLTILGFLIFWVLLEQPLAHFRIQAKPRTKAKVIFREIQNSCLTLIVIGTVGWIFDLLFYQSHSGIFYDNCYQNIGDRGWLYIPLSVFLLLVFEDTYFYWMHRLLHHPFLYSRVHRVHHYSVDPTPFSTYSFHPLEAAILFFGQMLTLSIVPISNLAVGIWALLTLFNSVVIHLGYEIYPQWFTEFWLTKWKTPSTHHNMHHEKVRGNYALIFTWWDKLMNTEFPDYPDKIKAVQQRKIIASKNKH
jgi:Delta7-sterol 5-desaturase